MIDVRRDMEYSTYSEEILTVEAFGKNIGEVTIYAKRSDGSMLGSISRCTEANYVVGQEYEFIILDNEGIMMKECVNKLNEKMFAKAKEKFKNGNK